MKMMKTHRTNWLIDIISGLLIFLLAMTIEPIDSCALTLRADITGPGVIEYEGVKRIIADSQFTISVYANNT